MVESTFSAIVLGAGALLSAGGAAYYLWRGFIHGIRRRRIMVRQVTFTGLPAFRWGLISVGYGVLFLAVALIGARDVFLWLIGS